MSKLPTENINELDFSEIRKNLLSFVKNNSEFSNYDFEASGLNFIVDLLAYNTQYNAFYLNQVSNEMFLDTAQKRKNVVSLAKQLGYLATSKKSATATINLKLTNTQNYLGPFTLKKDTVFTGSNINDENLPFITVSDTNILSAQGFSKDILVYQGSLEKESILVNNLQMEKRYVISSKDVDIETLKVFVKENPNSILRKRYYRAYDITLLNKNSEIFYIEENHDGKYELVFGDNVIGKEIKNNNLIELEYLKTSGFGGNDYISFDLRDRGIVPTDYLIRTVQFSSGGANEEDIESIRVNSRKMFLSQNRSVTEQDYEVAIMKNFNYVDSVSVWGGEKNTPPLYGKIFCAIKPKNRSLLVTGEKNEIVEKLNQLNIITVHPIILDPEYSFLKIKANVIYDAEEITTSESTIIENTKNEILNFVQNNLLRFNKKFHVSDISRLIDNLDETYLASNVDISLYQKRTIDVGVSTFYYMNFNNVIKKGTFFATAFDHLDSNGRYIKNCYLTENTNYDGISVATNLKINGVTRKTILIENIGSIDYENGIVKLETFAPYLPNALTEMTFQITPDTFIITPAKEQILTATVSDIEVIPEAFVDRSSSLENTSKSGLFRYRTT